MYGNRRIDCPTTDLAGQRVFPEPVAVVSLRDGTTYRAVDEDGQPVLIITDGVTTVALESGLRGLSFGVVVAAQRLAEAVGDYATSIAGNWHAQEGPPSGRHRRNRRQGAWARRRNRNSVS